MKTVKKIATLFLTVVMVVLMMPQIAFAGNETINSSLPVPSIYTHFCNKAGSSTGYISFLCPGDAFGESYTGYQLYYSTDSGFSNYTEISVTYEWNNMGYCIISPERSLQQGTTYYARVRSYLTDSNGNTSYSNWSATYTATIPNYTTQLTGSTNYSYELYATSESGSTLYDDVTTALFLKTDNPDPNSFDIVTDCSMSSIVTMKGQFYSDVNYKDTYLYTQAKFYAVPGGYIWKFCPREVGTFDFEIREYSSSGYRTASVVSLTINDSDAAASAWVDKVIAEHTTSSMTNVEKMNSICQYLLSSFTYLANDGTNYSSLVQMPNSPYYAVYRWDSYTSPAVLCEFAKRIGGFDSIVNMYNHYSEYGYTWANGHWLCRCTVGDNVYYFQACPLLPTGTVSLGKVDLTNSSNLYTIKGATVKATTANVTTQDMYRMYNPNSGEHFYTASAEEANNLVSVGWNYEGIGWKAPVSGGTPVYRLYNPNAGDHHYTMSAAERDNLVNLGWNYEGIGWYSASDSGQVLYRLYNPNAVAAGAHHYTGSVTERDNLVNLGWNYEGIGWYGVN